jgi:hypothetical protein
MLIESTEKELIYFISQAAVLALPRNFLSPNSECQPPSMIGGATITSTVLYPGHLQLLQHDPQLERKFAKPFMKGEICFDLLDLAKISERLYRDFCEDWFFDHPKPRI